MKPGIQLQLKRELSQRRIARSLSAILVLTLVQVGIGAVISPVAQAATAATGTVCQSTVTTAGTVSDISTTAYCILKFTSGANDWVAPVGVTNVSLLIVGGGGGGGGGRGGGGGAGGFFEKTVYSVSENTSYAITVGAGGTGNVGNGNNGGASVFSDITIAGGGGGAGAGVTPVNVTGASAGGAGFNYETNQPTGGTSTPQIVSGVTVLAYSGAAPACTATSSCVDGTRNTGGGGGAGSAGIGGAGGDNKGGYNGTLTPVGTRPDGGNGVQTSFTGSPEYFAAGGGGSTGIHYGEWNGGLYVTASFGRGGNSIGGNGGYATSGTTGQLATAGTANTGSGGGGGACSQTNGLTGAAGGSGVVIIKWVKPITTTSIANQSAAVSQQVTFTYSRTAIAAGISASRTWQFSADGGASWSTVNYATSAENETLTVPAVNLSHSGRLFRAQITLTNNNITTVVYTNNAQLTVFALPSSDTDTALSLNGSSQYAVAADSSGFGITNAVSLEAWVKPETFTTGVWNLVLCKEGVIQLGFQVVSGVAYWHYGISGSSTLYANVNTNIPVLKNEWHHIAITRAASTNSVNFFVDGQRVFTGSADSAGTGGISTTNTWPFTVGARKNGSTVSGYFGGQIDHAMIFGSERSLTEVKSDMQSYTPTNSSAMIAYYDFNDGSTTDASNRVFGAANTTNLTIVNSAKFTDIKSIATSGPYTVVQFPRTYLTSSGGWRTPESVSAVTAFLVGGGGGGGWNSGGGGSGGGVLQINRIEVSGVISVVVGVGGRAALGLSTTVEWSSLRGETTTFGSSSVAGGNFGTDYTGNSSGSLPGAAVVTSTGSSGAGGRGSQSASSGTTGVRGVDGFASSITGSSVTYAGGGGGGAYSAAYVTGGAGGGGAGGGVGSPGLVSALYGTSGTAGLGGGGGASADHVHAGFGGSGIVIVRWITAQKPAYSKPSIAYLNAGMTETFTTNVASDSATAVLTRTFRWESTTPSANGVYTLIKQGTGATNAALSWIPSDSRTSGSGYLYRLIVTDSDTAGLFITDSSTTYAVINDALVVSGNASFGKTINLSKSESFTISLGTPTYRASLTSINTGITLDTSTAGVAVIKVSETMTVGTYYETLTVTDSVSASVITPLTIVVVAPPNLLNTGEIITDGLQLNYDIGNSASLIGESGTATTGLTLNDLSGRKRNAGTNVNPDASNNTTGCVAPKFTSENGGALDFSGDTKSCYYVSGYNGTNLSGSYTVEAWFKVTKTLTGWTAVLSQSYKGTSPISVNIGTVNDGLMHVAFWNGGWRYEGTGYAPTIGRWTHIAGTYNGSRMTTYIDGAFFDDVAWVDSLGTITNTRGLLIGNGHLGDVAFPGLVGAVRIYNRSFTAAEIAANYNATKYRFQSDNSNLITPTKKYGTVANETFTATAGYGADTISYAVGNKSGVTWTTTGSNTFLKLLETLTATTHYDTITVTDSLGASTYLPLKMVISKADTLTISMDTATTVVYSGAPITVYPKPYFKGLIAGDTLTVSTRFTSLTYTDSATVPSEVDTYTVIAADPVFTSGALSNYVNVIYETSTAKVTQANQNKLTINLYGAVAGTPFLIQTFGGSGDGAVTESVTAGSTATGCAVSNHVLSNTSPSTQQLTCNILVTKAASKNYKVETLTATVYFMLYVNNMPTNQVGSGSTIGLNGINSVWVDPGEAPTITGFNILGSCTPLCSSRVEISGTGFGDGSNATTYVKFWRNKVVALGSGSSGAYVARPDLIVIAGQLIPSGITEGPIMVVTQYGTAVSADPYIP